MEKPSSGTSVSLLLVVVVVEESAALGGVKATPNFEPKLCFALVALDMDWSGNETGRDRVGLLVSWGRVECGGRRRRQRNRSPEQTVAPPGIASQQRSRFWFLFLPLFAESHKHRARWTESVVVSPQPPNLGLRVLFLYLSDDNLFFFLV